MDLITRKNFGHVERGLMMNIKSDGTNINTEFEIDQSNSNMQTKNNISKKFVNKRSNKHNNIKENNIKKVESDDIIKKREKNRFAARKCREKKRLFFENLKKELENKNNYIQELEKKLNDFNQYIDNLNTIIEGSKKD